MMLVTKLKAVGVAVLAAVGLTTGLGAGLTPAQAGDDKPAATAKAVNPKPPGETPESDAAFLNRLCLDLRGTPATVVEKVFFGADGDANKRRKVIDWFLADEHVKAFLARKHGVSGAAAFVDVTALAFSPDGQQLAIELKDSTATAGLLRLAANSDAGKSGTVMIEQYAGLLRQARAAQRSTVTVAQDFVVPHSGFYRIIPDESAPALEWYFRLIQSGAKPQVLAAVVDTDPPAAALDLFFAQPADRTTLGVWVSAQPESDADFLKRVVKEARGTAPTTLEEKYFAEDKDQKKREKLLDALLKEPSVAKKLGDDWKKKMLQPPEMTAKYKTTAQPELYTYYRVQRQYLALARQPDRLDKLLGELIDAKKTDAQILDALTLAIVGRQPNDGEKLTLAAVAKASDRKAAWSEIIQALAATEEAKKYAADLAKRNPPTPKKP